MKVHLLEADHLVVLDDGVDAVRNGQDRARRELIGDDVLITSSVSRSTDAAALARDTILVSLSRALARQSICLCPATCSSRHGDLTGAAAALTPCSPTACLSCGLEANQSSSSPCCLNARRLSRTLPENRMGSWGMHVILSPRTRRRPWSVPLLEPHLPAASSTSRQSATMRSLLPLRCDRRCQPSRQLSHRTRPLLSTRGRPGRYLISSRSNDIAPAGIQPDGGFFGPPLTIAPVDSSVSSSVNSEILSTLTMVDSTTDMTRMSQESSPVMSMA